MFIGRKEYLDSLGMLWNKSTASLVTCRGRRRIGKSTLIEEFAARTAEHFIEIEGLPPCKGMTDRRQRRHFCQVLSDQTGCRRVAPQSWTAAFKMLDEAVSNQGRTVILLDEISWMGSRNPDFAGFLKGAWDKFWRKHENLIVVLCGSVSSWIADNILNSTGFVGRNSLDVEVSELSLPECVSCWGAAGERLSTLEKLDFLAVTGGVPRYVEEIQPGYSVAENIGRMCFSPDGLLFREFDATFSEVFGRTSQSRGKVLRALSEKPLSMSELAAAGKKTANGRLSRILKELEYAGFVSGDAGLNPETGEPFRIERYRIRDAYTRFYLHYVEPRREAIQRNLFKFSSVEQLVGWNAWLGLQFETLVLNHVKELFPHLGLGRTLVLSAAPYQRKNAAGENCQIDLLIQTASTALVVEIKRRKRIDRSVIDEVREKVRRLKVSSGRSIRTALVYAGELSEGVPAEGYFDFIVPAEKLLLN